MTKEGLPVVRRLRRLSQEEIELWLTVAAGVARLPGSVLPDRLARPQTAAVPEVMALTPTILPKPPRARTTMPPLAPLERKLKQKLSRGRTTADAAIDLHGYRQDEALPALRRFLGGAQRDGLKVVLVVTGKGRTAAFSGDSVGVLRRAVPLWLAMPEFRSLVIGYEEAAQSHGGSGALYVRLRRLSPTR